ncbi:d1.1 [Ichnoviriform fugitivi]|uniref:D1.1 n=1 Tax=Ichnoviriform fugitivi TaxID=265522 RepID=A2Q0J0_9VIRU|nr:d1.1 [Ichnoviriform fugitivi]BAF45705.1 d1.1 [Ichnoviriform fugitivi]
MSQNNSENSEEAARRDAEGRRWKEQDEETDGQERELEGLELEESELEESELEESELEESDLEGSGFEESELDELKLQEWDFEVWELQVDGQWPVEPSMRLYKTVPRKHTSLCRTCYQRK